MVELFEMWSSPPSANAAQLRPVPAMLACRKMSPERSTPGPLHVIDLAAQHRGRGDVLVDAGDEVNAMVSQQRRHAIERQVVGAERRAFVAGNERRGVQPCALVAPHLIDRQPNQRLHAGQIDAPALLRVLVVESHWRGAIIILFIIIPHE